MQVSLAFIVGCVELLTTTLMNVLGDQEAKLSERIDC